MLIGDAKQFAIESQLTVAWDSLGLRGLGYFLVHVLGKSYGVKESDATAMACSYETVKDRLKGRGSHCVPFSSEPDPLNVANAYRRAIYWLDTEQDTFFGMTYQAFRDCIHQTGIDWAPDGDEAFDDGSYILQFDVGDRVRLIAFTVIGNPSYREDEVTRLSDLWLPADDFYGILERWSNAFEGEWIAAEKKDPECDNGCS